MSQTNDNTNFIDEKDRFKFIDDLSILEKVNLISHGLSSYRLKSHVASDVNSDHNQFLPPENFQSQQYLKNISNWTDNNLMKLNTDKSKYMIVNYTDNFQFSTRLTLNSNVLEQVKETRLLGVILRDDLTWSANTEFIVKKSYKRMLILHKLYDFQLPIDEMLGIYVLYIRSILESSAVVWHSSLTQSEQLEIERVQKVALRIILDSHYKTYENALELTGMETLLDRRTTLCKKFAIQSAKNVKTCEMFPLNQTEVNTRQPEKYFVQHASTNRLRDSAIPFMQRLLNKI